MHMCIYIYLFIYAYMYMCVSNWISTDLYVCVSVCMLAWRSILSCVCVRERLLFSLSLAPSLSFLFPLSFSCIHI